ncbi:MAG TPA: hypothetical protein VEX60_05955 [Pyrinomonadaceae bacterium]|nr:hypothetical protein [Pyrinomonadaceae bacterium]
MNGFDEEYERKVAQARERASAQGRNDVVDYLTLRAANDSMRARGAEWLLGAFTSVAGEMNREGAALTLARTEAHRFRVGHSTMVGPRLTLSRGLRSLTVEAGWPRGPRDGIVRGGGLASALVGHFGNRKADEELLLLPFEDEPRWLILEKTGARTEFFEDRVRMHLNRLLI